MRLTLASLVWAFNIEAVREVDWTQQKTYLVWQKKPFEVRLRRGFKFEDRKRGGLKRAGYR